MFEPGAAGDLGVLLVALHHAGHLFAPARDGLTGYLPGLLRSHGFQRIRVRTVPIGIDSSTHIDDAQQVREDLRSLLKTIRPFLFHWAAIPDSFEALYRQALHDLAETSFG